MEKEKLVTKLITLRETFAPYSDPYDLINHTLIFLNEQESEIKRLRAIVYSVPPETEQQSSKEIDKGNMRTFHETGYMQMSLFKRKGRR
jgi:hypothetical protein